MSRVVWRASSATYVVLIAPWAAIAMLTMLAALKNPEMWAALGVSLGVAVALAVWLAAFKVEVSDSELRYSSLMRGKRVLRIDRIRSIELKISGTRIRERFRSPATLEICADSDAGVEEVRINLKVLSRGAGAGIANAVKGGWASGEVLG